MNASEKGRELSRGRKELKVDVHWKDQVYTYQSKPETLQQIIDNLTEIDPNFNNLGLIYFDEDKTCVRVDCQEDLDNAYKHAIYEKNSELVLLVAERVPAEQDSNYFKNDERNHYPAVLTNSIMEGHNLTVHTFENRPSFNYTLADEKDRDDGTNYEKRDPQSINLDDTLDENKDDEPIRPRERSA